MEGGMTNAEFNAFLETLARLVESKAKSPEKRQSLSDRRKRNKKVAATLAKRTATTPRKVSREPYPGHLDCTTVRQETSRRKEP